MSDPRARALRIIESLKQRTEARGCTPAEAKEAKARIAQLVSKYKLEHRGAPQPASRSMVRTTIIINGKVVNGADANSIAQAFVQAFFGMAAERRRRW